MVAFQSGAALRPGTTIIAGGGILIKNTIRPPICNRIRILFGIRKFWPRGYKSNWQKEIGGTDEMATESSFISANQQQVSLRVLRGSRFGVGFRWQPAASRWLLLPCDPSHRAGNK